MFFFNRYMDRIAYTRKTDMPSLFTDVRFHTRDAPGVDAPGARYVSGVIVFDEVLLDGRLVTRYWNPNGQVWPEMHLESLQWNQD